MKTPTLKRTGSNDTCSPKFFALDQCALYKLTSKKRLAQVLLTPLDRLLSLSGNEKNYNVFCLPEEICPFTGKRRKERWVQEPKVELRGVHERIRKLLSRVAPPAYAHAAVKGRSYRSNANVHRNAARIATFDIRKFYPSTTESRTYDFWSTQMMCAPDVARLLARLTCFCGKLPTGSPLSPLLSLFANKRMFDALDALAAEHSMTFSCYVDDLTFSGNVLPAGLSGMVQRLAWRFGHSLSNEKTRFFNRIQSKHVTGVVIYGGALHVPYARFRKARAISRMLERIDVGIEAVALARKLSGLLAEAAYLDSRYAKHAAYASAKLRSLNQQVQQIR